MASINFEVTIENERKQQQRSLKVITLLQKLLLLGKAMNFKMDALLEQMTQE